MSQISILLAIPTLGCSLFSACNISVINLHRLCNNSGIKISTVHTYNGSIIQNARNSLSQFFMQSEHTHLLFIDSDMEFNAEDIIKMLDFNEPIVAALCHKKKICWEKLAELANDQSENKAYSIEDIQRVAREHIYKSEEIMSWQNDFVEVDKTGTGIMLIKKEVFDTMRDAYPDEFYNADGGTVFRYFDTVMQVNEDKGSAFKYSYIGEDFWFCERWRKLGGKIHVYNKFRVNHWGVYAF